MLGRRKIARIAFVVATVCAAGGVSPMRAQADDEGSRDEMIARIVEAATVRMKALVEEARLLEISGRRDEAITALRRVPSIYDDAMRVVRSMTPTAVASLPRLVEVPASARPIHVPTSPPPPLAPRVEAPPPLSQPRADPVGPAVEFLLARQGADGHFHAAGGQFGEPAPEAGHDRLTTGLAILALADVVGDSAETRSREVAAIRLAAAALAREVGDDGALADDPQDHACAAWGLATAFSRLGDAAWEEPLRRAVGATLSTQGPDGLWRDAKDGVGDALLATASQAAFLHEVLPTAAGTPAEAIRGALDRAAAAPARVGAPTSPRASLAAFDVLRRGAAKARTGGLAADPLTSFHVSPSEASDPLFVLWGTVHARAAYGFVDEASGRLWWEKVLVPAMNRQRADDGPARGSWDPADPLAVRWGRVATTALALLAWEIPSTPWIPAAR